VLFSQGGPAGMQPIDRWIKFSAAILVGKFCVQQNFSCIFNIIRKSGQSSWRQQGKSLREK